MIHTCPIMDNKVYGNEQLISSLFNYSILKAILIEKKSGDE